MGWTVLAASPFKTCGLTETAELRSCADLNSVALELQGGRLSFVCQRNVHRDACVAACVVSSIALAIEWTTEVLFQ